MSICRRQTLLFEEEVWEELANSFHKEIPLEKILQTAIFLNPKKLLLQGINFPIFFISLTAVAAWIWRINLFDASEQNEGIIPGFRTHTFLIGWNPEYDSSDFP